MTEILCDVGDETSIIEEERQIWLTKVLVSLGADEDIISRNTIAAKEHIMFLGFDIQTHINGTIKIYRPENITFELPEDEIDVEINQKLIAEWKKPTLIRIKESPGKYYYKITLNEWALPLMKG